MFVEPPRLHGICYIHKFTNRFTLLEILTMNKIYLQEILTFKECLSLKQKYCVDRLKKPIILKHQQPYLMVRTCFVNSDLE